MRPTLIAYSHVDLVGGLHVDVGEVVKDGEGARGETSREDRRLGRQALYGRDEVLALSGSQGAPLLANLDVGQVARTARVGQGVERGEGVEAAQGEAGIDGELSKVGKGESARDGRGRRGNGEADGCLAEHGENE